MTYLIVVFEHYKTRYTEENIVILLCSTPNMTSITLCTNTLVHRAIHNATQHAQEPESTKTHKHKQYGEFLQALVKFASSIFNVFVWEYECTCMQIVNHSTTGPLLLVHGSVKLSTLYVIVSVKSVLSSVSCTACVCE